MASHRKAYGAHRRQTFSQKVVNIAVSIQDNDRPLSEATWQLYGIQDNPDNIQGCISALVNQWRDNRSR